MLEQIKRISKQTGEAETPTRFLFGTVTKLSPLTVFVDSRFYLSSAALVRLKESEQAAGALAIGDKVVLLRNQGGQQYLILGRV